MSSPEPGRPRRVLKRVAIALAFLLGTGVVAFWVSAIWGRSVLNSYAAAWKLELAEERARLAARRLPVLSGQPLEENAAPRYTRALAALDTTDYEKLWWPLEPGSPLTPELSRLLEKHRADLAPFLEALRCTRCDWETAWEEGYDAHVPDFHACQMIASLLILEGEERAFQGDGRGAARRYMEAIRFGADVGAPGNLVQVMGGIAETQRGLNALARLFMSEVPGVDRSEIERGLASLEDVLPQVALGYRGERLTLGSLTRPDANAGNEAIVARGVRTVDLVLRHAEGAASSGDRLERARVAAEIKEASSATNPIATLVLPAIESALRSGDALLARQRLLRSALAIEKLRSPDGLYPAEVELPVDPRNPPVPLHYMLLEQGHGYRIWSQGEAGAGGELGGALALERRPPPLAGPK